MKAEIIKEKLLNDDCIYDFKKEFQDNYRGILEKSPEQLSNLERRISYYRYNKSCNDPVYSVDCDVSELAVNLYSCIYGYLKGSTPKKQRYYNREMQYMYYLETNDEMIFKGDTMTSFLTLYYMGRRIGFDKEMEDLIEELAALYSSAGNLLPVPEYFNCARTGYVPGIGAAWDFWDLSLNWIFQWYKTNDLTVKSINETNDESLEKMFSKSKYQKRAVQATKKWLYMFGNWDGFVEENYMNPYVEQYIEENETHYGEPILFWPQHSSENINITDRDTYKSFLKKLISMIKERNNLLLEVVRGM